MAHNTSPDNILNGNRAKLIRRKAELLSLEPNNGKAESSSQQRSKWNPTQDRDRSKSASGRQLTVEATNAEQSQAKQGDGHASLRYRSRDAAGETCRKR